MASGEGEFKRLGELVDGIVAQVCSRHYSADTQEHQFTSKIADRLEERLKGVLIGQYLVDVYFQDFSDKGRGSKEAITGADLYISVVAKHIAEPNINKGMLVQSKWDRTKHSGVVSAQSAKMRARTEASYIFAYGPTGVEVEATDRDFVKSPFTGDTIGRLIEDAFDCKEGDSSLGRDLSLPPVEGLNRIMERLSTSIGIGISLFELE